MSDTATGVNARAWRAPSAPTDQVSKAAQPWNGAGGTRRLWDKDTSLWTGADDVKWLGWLGAGLETLIRLVDEAPLALAH